MPIRTCAPLRKPLGRSGPFPSLDRYRSDVPFIDYLTLGGSRLYAGYASHGMVSVIETATNRTVVYNRRPRPCTWHCPRLDEQPRFRQLAALPDGQAVQFAELVCTATCSSPNRADCRQFQDRQFYLKDEDDRTYNLDVLAGPKTNEALVPFLWTYEVANGLVMAHRRKRLAEADIATIIESLKALPITVDSPDADKVMRLPVRPCAQAPVNGI